MTSRSTPMSAGHVVAFTRIFLFVAITLAVSLMSMPASAQSTAGRVLGTVTDASGAAVAGATVVVTDTQRGTSRILTTDSSGEYVAPDLIPGTYKIRVEAKGFKTVERPSVAVEVATDVRADMTLQPGNVSEVITVSADVPLINSISATLGGTLSNKEINDLPLNGRNYENLLQLRPGVMRYPGGGFSTTSTDGLRAEDNAYFVEGLFNSEPFSGQGIINGAGIAGDSATILADRCHSGIQRSRKSTGGIWLETGSGCQRWLEIRYEHNSWQRIRVRPRRSYGRAQLFQRCSCPENSSNAGTVWWQFRRRDRKGQSFLLRRLRGTALRCWKLLQRYHAVHAAADTGARCGAKLHGARSRWTRLQWQHSKCDCRSSGKRLQSRDQRPLQRTLYQSSQPIDLRLHCLGRWYGNL